MVAYKSLEDFKTKNPTPELLHVIETDKHPFDRTSARFSDMPLKFVIVRIRDDFQTAKSSADNFVTARASGTIYDSGECM
jgi:hypothetical protein